MHQSLRGGIVGALIYYYFADASKICDASMHDSGPCRFADPMGLCNRTGRPSPPNSSPPPPFRSITMVSKELFQGGGAGDP